MFGVALGVRAPYLFDPASAVHWWRPSDNASIARNYLHNGFAFFYPQVDWGGNAPGYVEMEFPIVQFGTALLYRLFGFHESLAVVIPLVASLGVVWATYLLARHLLGDKVALWAGIVAALSTSLARFGQSLFGETTLVLAGVVAVYAFLLWTERQRTGWFIVSAMTLSLAVLLKPTALVLGLPVLLVALSRFGRGALLRPSLWVFALLTLTPPLLWYLHAYQLGSQYGNSVGILSGGYVKLARWEIFSNPEFYLRLGWWTVMYHLTPVAFLGLMLGLYTKLPRQAMLICHGWILAVLVQVVIAAEGNFVAIYYQILLVPPAAILAGVGLNAARLWLGQRKLGRWRLNGTIAALIVAPAVISAAGFSMYRFWSGADFRQFGATKAAQGRLVGSQLRAGALMIYSARNGGASNDRPRGQHLTPPDVFYFSGHRGWFVAIDWLSTGEIEALRSKGAEYFVASDYWANDVSELRSEKADVYTYLNDRYQKILDRAGVLIFDLTAAAGHTDHPAQSSGGQGHQRHMSSPQSH